MHSINHMHRASAPGSGCLDLSLAGRRASRRTRSQRVAVVVAQVAPALLRSSSMEVLERPSAQDPAKSGQAQVPRVPQPRDGDDVAFEGPHPHAWLEPPAGVAVKDEKSGQGTRSSEGFSGTPRRAPAAR